ncbi:MAG: UDP-N-acetylmuramoyl-tripeptide--D-alanyl-D-alanine ligase [Oscillospiraceae bacterium]|nr:UDP-N-acetylmuramoyl-tripeptide--D-alanyl-D-alanine ligase [Oscillospiraceae bacterium]
MATITLRQAAAWCGGQVDEKYADVTFLGANNDSRKLLPGQLFVALQGQRDGHDFIPMAMEKGAAAVLCSRSCGDYPAIIVEDPRRALGDIARQERKRIGMKVVGVTGSVGKSTTKEMIACVLDGSYRVEKTPVNQNNDIGMPMAILSMRQDTQVAVLEMGMNHFREIAYLSSIAQPDVAVIVNIGTMHIEHLGNREGILQAKMEILEGMCEGGTVILNGDDDLLWSKRELPHKKLAYFAENNAQASVLGQNVEEEDGLIRFQVSSGNLTFPVELSLEGRHYVSDALAAVSVGIAMGVSAANIQERLSLFRNMAGRQEIFSAKGCTVIKDCYNAGPESMKAALTVLGKKEGRRVAVLGDMLELGVCTQAEHYRVGRIAAENADILIAYGPNGKRVISGALTGGMPEARAMAFEDRDLASATLKRIVKPGDVLLFKGSRGMHMELILEKFLEDET